MKTLSLMLSVFLLSACTQDATGPSRTQILPVATPEAVNTFDGENARTMNVANYVRINSITGVPPGTPCVQATMGERFYTYDISAYNPAIVAYEYEGAVFHSPTSGCAGTVENPSTRGGSVTGQTVLQPGETANLIARFETQAFSCGRVQIDHGFKPTGSPGMLQGNFTGMFYGLVIDYGVDCGELPPTKSNQCELAAFRYINPITITGNTASMSLQLNPEYDNVQVYFASFGAHDPHDLLNGELEPAFPQQKVYETTFTLRSGVMTTISVPVVRNMQAWQVDVVCVGAPDILLSRQTLAKPILQAALGNNW